MKWGDTPVRQLEIPRGRWTASYRFERVGAALKAGLLPLSRFDALPENDRTEIIEYLRELELMRAWDEKQAVEEMRHNQLRKR